MIKPAVFYDCLKQHNITFFTGVPDSLLKDLCAYITGNLPSQDHIIAANEGNAISLATGYHLATGKFPVVYMQNSGIGNAVNPLLSLVDEKVYSIPVLLIIGWRGEPGTKDEPQHVKQGEITLNLLDAMGIKYTVLSKDEIEAKKQLTKAIKSELKNNKPHALVVQKGTFDKYKAKEMGLQYFEMYREDAIEFIVSTLHKDDVLVSTTGKTSRELFECRVARNQAHNSDFLTVGSMGHASQIALGIALQKKDRRVVCLDGDGAMLMHTGGMAIIGNIAPKNLMHIVLNNGAHESVGGQPTVGFSVDMPNLARACNYKDAITVKTKEELGNVLKNISEEHCPLFIEVKINVGSRDNLGRPTLKPIENKVNFMKNLL